MNNNKISDLCVYETQNYEQFQIYDSNRNLTQNNLLEESILKSNLLKFNPMIVSSDYHVIDGQHRLDIAKRNNLKIFYMIDNNGDDSKAQELNISRKNWSQVDHVRFFAKKGKTTYIFINQMIVKYKISVTAFVECFCCIRLDDKIFYPRKGDFRKGLISLRFNNIEIFDYLERYNEIADHFRHITGCNNIHLPLQRSLMKLVGHPEYCHERFMKTLNNNPSRVREIEAYRNTRHINECMMDNVYNKHIKPENRIKL